MKHGYARIAGLFILTLLSGSLLMIGCSGEKSVSDKNWTLLDTESDSQTITVLGQKFDCHATVSRDGSGNVKFVGDDIVFPGLPGEPQIPYRVFQVVLPGDADLATVRVRLENVQFKEVFGNKTVRPVPPVITWVNGKPVETWPEDKTIVDGKDAGIYTKDDYFPNEIVGKIATGLKRRSKIVTVPVALFTWNPVTGKLLRLVNAEPEIDYETQGSGILDRDLSPAEKLMFGKWKSASNSIVTSAGRQSIFDFAAPESILKSEGSGGGSGLTSYVIITTNAIVSNSAELVNFARHKDSRNFQVHVVTEDSRLVLNGEGTALEAAESSGWGGGDTADDRADNIHAWLAGHYLDLSIEYVLLIGNPHPRTGDVPMKMLANDSPSDYYYANLTGNWDLNGNGVYGEFYYDMGITDAGVGFDLMPEVIVGRISNYGDITELDRILAKTIAYQNTPHSETFWRQKALFAMIPLGKCFFTHPVGESIKNDFLKVKAGWKYHRAYEIINEFSSLIMDDVGNLLPPAETTSCSIDGIITEWNSSHAGLVMWYAHGGYDNATNIIDIDHSSDLNDSYPAFIYQNSCLNAYPEITPNLSHSLLANGAIATVAATRSAGERTLPYNYSKEFLLHNYSTGISLQNAKCTMSNSGNLRFELYVYNQYGDPECGITDHLRQQYPDPEDSDYDDDGISDKNEGINANGIVEEGMTDPCSYDTDHDGLMDGMELGYSFGQIGPDTDLGIFEPDTDRYVITDPTNGDTDGDGILDGVEDGNHNGRVDSFETDPSSPDTDGDELPDGMEDINHNGEHEKGETSAFDVDSDDDGLFDGDEDLNHNGELNLGETDPLNVDTDGDGIQDGTERGLTDGDIGPDTDPAIFIPDSDPATVTDPSLTDTDGDGVSDGVEDINHNGALEQGEADPNNKDIDSDGDGLPDWIEMRGCTDKNKPDTDDDGIPDGVEDRNKNGIRDIVINVTGSRYYTDTSEFDPCNKDTDGDDIDDNIEDKNQNGIFDSEDNSNAADADTDDDGVSDGIEDADHDGTRDTSETSCNYYDSDGDYIPDGTELGYTTSDITKYTTLLIKTIKFMPFKSDTDPQTTTNPIDSDTDNDGIIDGVEDLNCNGSVDWGETDPNNADTDGDGVMDGIEDANHNGIVDSGETKPTKADTDGDGTPDGAESDPTHCQGNILSIKVLKPFSEFFAYTGQGMQVSVMISYCNKIITGATVSATFSNGDSSIMLSDDGEHDDGGANDGIYSAVWTPGVVASPASITIYASKNSYVTSSAILSGHVDFPQYSVSPACSLFWPQGGMGTITIEAPDDGQWTTASNTVWITILSGSSGTGNGTAIYSVAPNTTGTLRTGYITAGGTKLTIRQIEHYSTIAVGQSHYSWIRSDGRLFSWGTNSYGQLGTGDTDPRNYPEQIGSDTDRWTSVSTGNNHTIALKSDGTVWGWGNNTYGQLGIETLTNASTPQKIGSDNSWIAVFTGMDQSFGLKSDGTSWAWGYNRYDKLGIGLPNQGYQLLPAIVINGNNFNIISSGHHHSLGINSEGILFSWGHNYYADLGINYIDANIGGFIAPTKIVTDIHWLGISAGYDHSFGITQDNQLYAWGKSYEAHSGANIIMGGFFPITIDGQWAQLSAGYTSDAGIQTNGTLWMWGDNSLGQLGTNDYFSSSNPVQIGDDNDWIEVNTNMVLTSPSALALKSDGTIRAWGYCMLGDEDDNPDPWHQVPVEVRTDTNYYTLTVTNNNNGSDVVKGYGIECSPNTPQPYHGCKETYIQGQTVTLTAEPDLGSEFTEWSGACTGTGACTVTLDQNKSVTATFELRDPVNVPDLGNMTEGQAEAELTFIGLLKGTVTWMYDNTTDNGLVISQDPPAYDPVYHSESQVAIGSSVNIVLSRGIPDILDLTGMSWIEAEEAIQEAGLTVGTITEEYSVTIPEWHVISQNQLTCDPPDICTTVNLVLSSGSPAYAAVSMGYYHTLTIKSDGTLWAWGDNSHGQLGDGTLTDSSSSTPIGIASNWAQVSAGYYHSTGIQSDGTLWAWGENGNRQLGIGTTTDSPVPVMVGSGTDWAFVSSGAYHTHALKSDGSLWGWGENAYGRLGDGTTTDHDEPARIGIDNDWKFIADGELHAIAIKTGGTLWAWGYNLNGQVGDGTTSTKTSPVQIGGDSNWIYASAGRRHSLGVKSDGTLWAWGSNTYGQLGDGTTTQRKSPVNIGASLGKQWVYASAGAYHSIAVASDGTVWAWGRNSSGQLGTGNTVGSNTPVMIGTIQGWKYVDAGYDSTCAMKMNDSLYSWGDNSHGQLGNGTDDDKLSPVSVATHTVTVPDLSGMDQMSARYKLIDEGLMAGSVTESYSSTVQKGLVISQNPQAGVEVFNDSSVDMVVSLGPDLSLRPAVPNLAGLNLNQAEGMLISAGLGLGSVSKECNAGVAEGLVMRQEPASGTVVDPATLVSVVTSAGNGFIAASMGEWHIAVIKKDGTLWTWGDNRWNQLGDETHTDKDWPVQFGTSDNWTAVSAGYVNTVASNSDGSILEWGSTASSLESARAIPGNTWTSITAGNNFAVGIQSDGTLWAWGHSTYVVINSVDPVQIGTDNDWAQVSAYGSHVLLTKNNGTLWAWGYNSNGMLGDGTEINRTSPVRIGTDMNWVSIATGITHSIGIKSNGTLWAWGSNNRGQLGLGSGVTKSFVPVQVGTATNWSSAACGYMHTLALKTNRTLWGWGSNAAGQFGDGTWSNSYTPKQCGTASDWAYIDTKGMSSLGIKTDSSLWVWGFNNYSQLGNGTTTNSNVPLQISSIAATVPDVTNMAYETQGTADPKALTLIEDAGLFVGMLEEVASDVVPKGYIISQEPSGGTRTVENAGIDLVVSTGPDPAMATTVPTITGLAWNQDPLGNDVTDAINGAGLVLEPVTYEYSDTVGSDYIISQSPAPGRLVIRGTTVYAVVSLGPAEFAVPDVRGKHQTPAEGIITGAGFDVGIVTTAHNADIPAGYVISQTPAPGSDAVNGTAIDLVVSLGLEPGTVPDIVTLTLPQAEQAIQASQLVTGEITFSDHETIPAGHVISQSPAAGTVLDVGTAVDIVVSLGLPTGDYDDDGIANGTELSESTDPNNRVLRTYAGNGMFYATPSLNSTDAVIAGTDAGYLYSINPDGTLHWALSMDPVYAGAAPVDLADNVYVATLTGLVHKVSSSGSIAWSYDISSIEQEDVYTAATLGPDGAVYVTSTTGGIYAINPDGTYKWDYQTGDVFMSGPILGQDGTLYAASHGGILYAIDSDNGIDLWTCAIGPVFIASPAIDETRGILYTSSSDGTLYATNIITETSEWTFTASSESYSTPVVSSTGNIYLTTVDGNIFAINSNGNQLWSFATGAMITGAPAIAGDGTMYITASMGSAGRLYCLSNTGSLKWVTPLTAGVLPPPVIGPGNVIHITDSNGAIMALRGDQ